MRAPGPFQRRNFALACAATEAFLGEIDPQVVAAVAGEVSVPGRLELVAAEPPTYVDAAHNPDGAAALAEALAEVAEGRPVIGCLAVLAEKDAEGMARALAPALGRIVCTEIPVAPSRSTGAAPRRSIEASELARAFEKAGLEADAAPDLSEAVGRARQLATEAGGVLVIAGSHYVLAAAREALGA